MRLLRAATVTLSRPVPFEFGTWPFLASNGVAVEISVVHATSEYADITDTPATVAGPSVRIQAPWESEHLTVGVSAEVECGEPDLVDGRLSIPDEPRKAAEAAIVEYADTLAVAHQCRRIIRSPFACVALGPFDNQNRTTTPLPEIHFDPPASPVPARLMPHRVPNALQEQLKDRRDGLTLMADSLSEETAVARVRGLFLVMERAFTTGPGATVRPLVDFLASSPVAQILNYTEPEVAGWMTRLRPLCMHADRRPEYVKNSDVAPFLPRLEQAAYDVLFNKKRWRDKSSLRREGLHFSSGLTPTGVTLFEQAATITITWMDPFGTFPLDRTSSTNFPPGWAWMWPGATDEAPRLADA